MTQDPKLPPKLDNPSGTDAPPPGSASASLATPDPTLSPGRKSPLMRQNVAVLLSLCLAIFLATGVVSLVDDSLVLLFNLHFLTALSGLLSMVSFLLLFLIYCLSGLTPIIPKRVFVPIIFLNLLALLAVFPTMIYWTYGLLQMDWLFSLLQVLLVLGIYRWLRGKEKFRWSAIEVKHLGIPAFSGRNLSVFLLLNIFVVLPALAAYLALSASLAVGHFSDGFLALRPGGLILKARTYVRDDGKTIVLFPMSHIAETDFYKAVSQSVNSNSIVLLEGVSDSQNLITNRLTYERAAKSLGLAEQDEDWIISQGELVQADVDVQEFSASTIAILNMVTLVHAQGMSFDTVLPLLQYSPPPDVQRVLFADLVSKRNEHLLQELHDRLPQSDHFVIPWGAVHMPGIADEIQDYGFRLVETREYVSIRFGPKRSQAGGAEEVQGTANSQ